MTDPILSASVLGASAFVAGAVNAMAGGGTLLTFPALLAFVNPVAANATSTVALLPGSMASIWGYRREVKDVKPLLKRLWLPSLMGGILGSLAVTRFPERIFEMLVPWLLLTASVLMLLQKPLSKWVQTHPHGTPTEGTMWGAVAFQFLVGMYGGYFGAGIGILMITSLSFLNLPDIHHANGLKTVLGTLINGITAVIFIVEGVVKWNYALPMAVASIAGGYAGARFARKLQPSQVRMIVIVIGFGVAAYAFYRRFAHAS